MFPTNNTEFMNEAQEAALNALYVQYGVSGWEELVRQTTFVRDKTDLPVQTVSDAGRIDICKVNGMDLSNGAEFTFPAAGITAGDTIAVLHLTDSGIWEHIEARAGDGVITGVFTSLSPVFYARVVLEEPEEPEYWWEEEQEPEPVNVTPSPKTGDTGMSAIAGIVALAAIGSIVAGRKSKMDAKLR